MKTVQRFEIQDADSCKAEDGSSQFVYCLPPYGEACGRAFTLIEVMVALGVFFIAVFAILGVLTNCLKNARALQQKSADAGMVAAELSLSNAITEGLDSGDFGDMYPGYTWTRDAYEAGTNGLFQADIIVQRPSGVVESKMSILLFRPQSSQSTTPRSPFGAGRAFR
jgi:general secretion pathway protein I